MENVRAHDSAEELVEQIALGPYGDQRFVSYFVV